MDTNEYSWNSRLGGHYLQPYSRRRSEPPCIAVSSSLSTHHTDLLLSRKPNRSALGRASPSALKNSGVTKK